MKKLIIFLSIIMCAACSPWGSAVPGEYIGFWAPESGPEFGFFEEFAILDNDFWNYENVQASRSKVRMELSKKNKNGQQNRHLEIMRLADSSISVLLQGGEQIICRNMLTDSGWPVVGGNSRNQGKFLLTSDTVGSATIIFYSRYSGNGWLRYQTHMAQYYTKRLSVYWLDFLGLSRLVACENENTDYVDFGKTKLIYSDDHYGFREVVNVRVQGVTEVQPETFKHIGPHNDYTSAVDFLMEPGDTLVLVYDDYGRMAVGGNNSRSYREAVDFCKFLGTDELNYCHSLLHNFYSYSDSEFLEMAKDNFTEDSLKLAEFSSVNNGKLSPRFMEYASDMIKYTFGNVLMHYYFESDSVGDGYRKFLETNFLPIDEARMYHNSAYWHFAMNFIRYNYEKRFGRLSVSGKRDCDYDFTKVDFLPELGFSDEFIELYKLKMSIFHLNDKSDRRATLNEYLGILKNPYHQKLLREEFRSRFGELEQ